MVFVVTPGEVIEGFEDSVAVVLSFEVFTTGFVWSGAELFDLLFGGHREMRVRRTPGVSEPTQ